MTRIRRAGRRQSPDCDASLGDSATPLASGMRQLPGTSDHVLPAPAGTQHIEIANGRESTRITQSEFQVVSCRCGLVVCHINNLGLAVIPAQAGSQLSTFWVPACAGMTNRSSLFCQSTGASKGNTIPSPPDYFGARSCHCVSCWYREAVCSRRVSQSVGA